jgi:predicted nucleic acid-binding protein
MPGRAQEVHKNCYQRLLEARVRWESVPDIPNRIIAETAIHLGLPLVTRDRKIHAVDFETI